MIFAGIVRDYRCIGQSLEQARQGELNILVLLSILAWHCCYLLLCFIERGQRRITVNYAKRQQGRKMYQAQSSHLPLKVNMAVLSRHFCQQHIAVSRVDRAVVWLSG